MEILDIITDIQQGHDTANQLLSILANKYFDDEPNGKDSMLLFAKDYRDMNELINAILKYSDIVKDELRKLYNIVEIKVKGD